jgi:hypothetical protein
MSASDFAAAAGLFIPPPIIWKILNYIGSKNINTFHNIGR